MMLFQNCLDKWYNCALKRLKTLLDKKIEKIESQNNLTGDGTSITQRFTVRSHIYMVFVISVILSCAITAALGVTVYLITRDMKYVNLANTYILLSNKAMFHERNFVAGWEDIKESKESIKAFEMVVFERYNDFGNFFDNSRLISNIEKYGRLLDDLTEINTFPPSEQTNAKVVKIRNELHQLSDEISNYGKLFSERTGHTMRKDMFLFKIVFVLATFFLFLFMLFIVHLLIYRVLRTMSRIVQYAKHLSTGQQIKFMPGKVYQDEFSDLASALEQMMKEFDRQQNIISQSHKLRAVGTLTAGVAHELNNPINNITLTAHMLLEDYHDLDEDERLDMIKDLIDEADRSRTIVRNLLDFARESESIMEPIGISDVVTETLKLAGNQLKLNGVHADLTIAPNLPRIHGDRQQLEQVFLNLILNALDVTLKGGQIRIDVERGDEPNFVVVKVADFGNGIPDHILHHIFDPFFTTKSKGKGTGLGLSVSQGIIAKHGGQITVSTKQKRGTTFTVKLPITTIPADIGGNMESAHGAF
ncbi:MAG: HAMP domain-containing histidine kinase [Nitrospirae bacterium]|nr:HAMP domain-containing histidine kinase [Nitrospirota bacterium]MBF0534196.1 HAMP domain-containing histidine kinase [Nitrospirota bacterium]MBF0615890.1 HAMP domain-containing histidine kinase [Nitrospirota bacterium]